MFWHNWTLTNERVMDGRSCTLPPAHLTASDEPRCHCELPAACPCLNTATLLFMKDFLEFIWNPGSDTLPFWCVVCLEIVVFLLSFLLLFFSFLLSFFYKMIFCILWFWQVVIPVILFLYCCLLQVGLFSSDTFLPPSSDCNVTLTGAHQSQCHILSEWNPFSFPFWCSV